MTHWISNSERVTALEKQVELLKAELEQYKEANASLKQQYQTLKVQNDRLLKKEAEHEKAKMSVLQKRIILSHAVITVPHNMVIGDRLENSIIKIYRGNTLTIADTAELINCKIIGLDEYADERASGKNGGTIEIKGLFVNYDPRGFAIHTHERVIICPGSRVVGNICAERIVVCELTRVRGRLASRDLITKNGRKKRPEGSAVPETVSASNEVEVEA
jgi:FtsZ-binding cell division protein ZapB